MASFNNVVLVGNVTRDVEVRYTPGGAAVTDIGLAVNERYKKGDEWMEETVFVDVTLWGRQAEVAGEYLTKGSPVLIQGKLRLDSWEQDGQKRSKLKVVADTMQLLGSKKDKVEGESEPEPKTAKPKKKATKDSDTEEVPF
jgi:single-strand DNA-binding protein